MIALNSLILIILYNREEQDIETTDYFYIFFNKWISVVTWFDYLREWTSQSEMVCFISRVKF